MKRRVVVSGMGVVSPAGTGLRAFTAALKAGLAPESVLSVKDFDPRTRVRDRDHSHGTQHLDPFIQYAVASAAEALDDAAFDWNHADPFRVGISVSSSKGGMHTLERLKDRFGKNASAFLGARMYCNTAPNFAAQWIARRWEIRGPALCYVAACATGTVAILEGARLVREGMADYCLAGASDASSVPLMLAAYRNMKALARDRMRPFDRRRDGFQVGEGAGIVFLETLESARARGAKIYGEVVGGAYGNDASDPLHFDEKEDSLARTIRLLMERSGLASSEIGYVNLHGTATLKGDIYETSQLKKAFGKNAYHIPMSSTKSMTGHMLGASGAVEVIASLAAMNEGFVPPTVSLENPDPACDLDYTPLKSRNHKIETAVSLSMGFGGHIAAVALRKV